MCGQGKAELQTNLQGPDPARAKGANGGAVSLLRLSALRPLADS